MIEGLKDDALKCAMDLGRDVVVAPDGVLRIVEAIIASWAGKLEIATKEIYREGGKKDGVLARVPGKKHGFLRVAPPPMVPKLDDPR